MKYAGVLFGIAVAMAAVIITTHLGDAWTVGEMFIFVMVTAHYGFAVFGRKEK